jgi:hypothetical protein
LTGREGEDNRLVEAILPLVNRTKSDRVDTYAVKRIRILSPYKGTSERGNGSPLKEGRDVILDISPRNLRGGRAAYPRWSRALIYTGL